MTTTTQAPQSPARSPASAGSPPNPSAELTKLKQQREQKNGDLTKLTKQVAALSEQITVLEKGDTDLRQVLTAYGQAYAGLAGDRTDLTDYFTAKRKGIEDSLGKNKELVDGKIAEYDSRIDSKKGEVEELKGKRDAAAASFEQANKELGDKQTAFDNIKNYSTNLSNQFKTAKVWRTQIEKEAGQNHPSSAYFFAVLLGKALDSADTNVHSQEELQGQLYAAWNDVNQAKTSARDKQQKWDEAKNQYEGSSLALDLLRQNRKDAILAAIAPYNAPPSDSSKDKEQPLTTSKPSQSTLAQSPAPASAA